MHVTLGGGNGAIACKPAVLMLDPELRKHYAAVQPLANALPTDLHEYKTAT